VPRTTTTTYALTSPPSPGVSNVEGLTLFGVLVTNK
jgi:hypothetical protein